MEREGERMDLTGKFAVGIHMALTGKTEALESMRDNFLTRVRRFLRREKGPMLAPVIDETVALRDRYAQRWAEVQQFCELEKTATFAMRPDPVLEQMK